MVVDDFEEDKNLMGDPFDWAAEKVEENNSNLILELLHDLWKDEMFVREG